MEVCPLSSNLLYDFTRKPAMSAEVRVLASANNWIEGAAVDQLRTAGLPGVTVAVGLPDLHPGRGFPAGAAYAVEGRLRLERRR